MTAEPKDMKLGVYGVHAEVLRRLADSEEGRKLGGKPTILLNDLLRIFLPFYEEYLLQSPDFGRALVTSVPQPPKTSNLLAFPSSQRDEPEEKGSIFDL